MSGAELLVVIAVAVGWPGVLVKIWDILLAPNNRAERALLGSMFCFSAACTAELTPVYLWLGRTLGYADLARLIVHTLVIVGACFLQTALLYWRKGRPGARTAVRRRWIAFGSVEAALILTFALDATSRDVVDVPNRFFDANLWLIAYSLIWYGYLGYAMASILYNAHVYRRQLARGLTWFGLWAMELAGVLGVAFCVHQVARMFADNAHHPLPWDEVFVGNLLMAATVITLEISIVLPSLIARVTDVPRMLGRRRDASTIEPLWQDLVDLFPRYQLRARRPGLDRMLTEVASGLLALSIYTDPDVTAAAEAAGRDANAVIEDLPVIVEACQVRCAVEAARYEWEIQRPDNGARPAQDSPTDTDTDADRRRYVALATAYQSEIVRAVAAEYKTRVAARTGSDT